MISDMEHSLPYFEKAIELGNMVMGSEPSLRFADARAAYLADDNAQELMRAYTDFQDKMKADISGGEMTAAAYQEALKQRAELEIAAKGNALIHEMLKAEAEYTSFANAVVDMLKSTMNADDAACGAGCGCSSR